MLQLLLLALALGDAANTMYNVRDFGAVGDGEQFVRLVFVRCS